MNIKHASILVLGLSCLMFTSACVVEERPAAVREVVVQTPPPAEIVETIPVRPEGELWVWQKGHWRWGNGGYYWQRGRWVEHPPRFAAWVAPHWEVRGTGYVFIEGRWK